MGKPTIPSVALLIETSHSSGRDILVGIGKYVREHRPWIIYSEPQHLGQMPPSWFKAWKGNGIIARLQDQRIAATVTSKKVPVVDVLGVIHPAGIPLVHVDNTAIGKMAAGHLAGKGFSSFGFFGVKGENWSIDRRDSFAREISAKGGRLSVMEVDRNHLEGKPWSELLKMIADWISGLDLPAGIMLTNDVQGLLVSEACRLAGRRVGSQIALLGIDNDRTLCEMNNPPLSSIVAGHEEVGYRSAELLDRMMSGRKPKNEVVLVEPKYVEVRESTDFIAVQDEAVSAAIQFIRAHSAGHVMLNDVARHVGVSRSVLQRKFRSMLDATIHELVIDARLDHAMRLLREGRHSMDDVAEKAGFGYAQNMGRVFRRIYGKSPKSYRRRMW